MQGTKIRGVRCEKEFGRAALRVSFGEDGAGDAKQ